MSKYSKKFVQIPEEEYLALLRLFTGDDNVIGEKVATDFRIDKVLKDKKLSELVKGKRYQMLAKKRKVLQNMVERKKGKTIEQQAEPLPTSGVVPTVKPATNLEQAQEEIKDQAANLIEITARNKTPLTAAAVAVEASKIDNPSTPVVRKVAGSTSKQNKIDQYNEYFNIVKPGVKVKTLKDHILDNKEHYLVTQDEHLHSNQSLYKSGYPPDGRVTVMDIVNLITGNTKVTSEKLADKNAQIYKSVLKRLQDDEQIKEFLRPEAIKQLGGGKMVGKGRKSIKGKASQEKRKYIIDSGLAKFRPVEKTKGLIRKHITETDIKKRKFKPLLWTKLGV